MHQVVIPAHRGEAPMFEGFVRELIRAYGRAMVQCVSVDAGFVTIQNLMMLAVSGIPYIAALKGNAGALHRRLSMVMGQGTDAPPPGGWIAETQEVRNKAGRTDSSAGSTSWATAWKATTGRSGVSERRSSRPESRP